MKHERLAARPVAAPLSIAPMMDRTDRHFRYLLRHLSQHTVLYTEMRTSGAVLHGHLDHQLGFAAIEQPICLQLGGDDPDALARCAVKAAEYGYDGLNLNVGCPSERVQEGRFGACLMRDGERVAACAKAMREASGLPVGVKHRIGIDDDDSYEFMRQFVSTVASAGVSHFSIHARKAWLSGLSPKENRTIPPLRYDDVFRLKAEYPALFIEINGGITTLEHAKELLQRVDAVMIGRAAWDRPYLFADADRLIFGDTAPVVSRSEVIKRVAPYFAAACAKSASATHVLRSLHGLFADQPGARRWKQGLAELARRPTNESRDFAERLSELAETTERFAQKQPLERAQVAANLTFET